ncbi:hypothetical protein GCM10009655_19440 [Rhodoglobus aureus]|uniref:Uncharacterized protein n=1 Tax=Rhodoglobus aureus TaxID=191497 RepID=A0ABP4GC21_9MICO
MENDQGSLVAKSSKTIDPRFDPAFQRGYSEVGPEDKPDLSPQAHYLGAGGAPTEISPPKRTKSLARNPWIYVLWALGVAAVYAGLAAQLWASSQLYGTGNVPFENYAFISTVQVVSPSVSNLGALCLAAALTIHTVSWMRKNQ